MKDSCIANRFSALASSSYAFANKINKTTQLGILSLALVVGASVILGVMSQTTEPATPVAVAPAPLEFPQDRTITYVINQRTQDVTITGRTDTDVSFIDKENGRRYRTKLEHLSAEDNAFIRAFVEPAPKKPVVAPLEFPQDRTVTDLKGRVMEGTITGKTDTTVFFTRKTDTHKFEIKLDTLSEEDNAFIKALVEPAPKLPSVLLIGGGGSNLIAKIKAAGYDVTIGLENGNEDPIRTLRFIKDSREYPDDQKVIIINPLELVKQYDILWFTDFSHYPTRGMKYEKWNQPHILEASGIQNKVLIIGAGHPMMDQTKYLLPSYDQDKDKRMFPSLKENYVNRRGNIIYYNSRQEEVIPGRELETYQNVLSQIKKAQKSVK